MPIRITASASGSDFTVQLNRFHQAAKAAVRVAMEGAAAGLQVELRQQLGNAFPSSRRAATLVSAKFYDETATKPPAILVHPRKGAGRMLTAHKGTTIRTAAGLVLAIPTKHVPVNRRADGGGRMTPAQVQRHFGERLTLVPAKAFGGGGRAWGYLVLRKQTVGRSGRVRAATAGRARQGRTAQTIVMFILVPQVTLPRRLDPDSIVAKWADEIPRLIDKAAQQLGIATR